MTAKLKKLPGVLSFQRALVVSDALFYNLLADGSTSELKVIRHGIRGTQNINRKISAGDSATAASARRQSPSNIQQTDSAKLDPRATALQVQFELRFIDLDNALFACAPGQNDSLEDIRALRSSFEAFIEKAKNSKGLEELACRYARNITNGRFLWRNRAIAQSVLITVSNENKKIETFDALTLPLNTFGAYSEGEKEIARVIAAGLRGNLQAKLNITAEVNLGVGGPVEVFPSQNYLENKESGFARSLYYVGDTSEAEKHTIREMGQAALRDQKIGNALRTIDTWYPAYSERGLPIAVEPNGANLEAQEFFREGKQSGFNIMLGMGALDPDSDDGMFLLACIIRGGVFSGSD